MSKFYFHFRQGQSYCADEEGCDFASADEAYLGAFAAAQELWRELLIRREDPRDCTFEVADDEGNELFALPFSEILDACKPRRNSLPPTVAIPRILENRRRAEVALKEVSLVVTQARSALQETLNETKKLLQQVSAPGKP